jgi:spore maturation protein CgeB
MHHGIRGGNSPARIDISFNASFLIPRGKDPGRVKITVFGLTISSSWGNGHATPYRAIIRALDRLGHSIHFFEKDAPYYSARRDFDSCDYCEILGLSRPLRVFYDLDTPVTLASMRSGEVEYLSSNQLPEFDLVLSFTGGKAVKELEETHHARTVRTLYGCVDPDDYYRVDPAPDFQCDLSYMGTYSADRQAKLDELLLEPSRRHPEKQFLLAGPLYPWNWEWPDNVRRREHVAPADHSRFYSSSGITLNITRGDMAANGWCPSGRFFEAAACGTPMITDTWEGLDSFFDLKSELRVVGRAEDVQDALRMPQDELRAMAARARQRTLDEHTGMVRARQLIRYFEEAHSGTSASMKKEVVR